MKAIIPIAGLGTRLLPFSKVIPKAMLPVHDRPCVQWLVEELNEAGVDEIIFITSKGQEMVEEFFSKKSWYDEELHNRGKSDHAEHLKKIRDLAKFHFVEQSEQLGDGHAVLQARHLIDEDEPAIVIFGDCLYHGENMIKKFVQHYEDHGKSIIAIQEVPKEEASKYGVISHKPESKHIIDLMIEKPETSHQILANKQPALAIIGRYLLSPKIWKHLEKLHSGSGEARLIDALEALQNEEDIHGLLLEGTWLDTGTLEGLQKATEHFKNQ